MNISDTITERAMSAERNAVSFGESNEIPEFDPGSDLYAREAAAEPSALALLPRLHEEAVETARLANVMGRVPEAAGVLAALGALTLGASLGSTALAPLLAWSLFVGIGAIMLLVLFARSQAAPFDLTFLRGYAADVNAALLYVGFAWGAGAFLAVPAGAGATGLILFAVTGVAAMAAVLRAKAPTLYFLIPGLGLPIMAAATGSQGLVAASILGLAALATAGLAYALENRTARRLGVTPLPSLIFS